MFDNERSALAVRQRELVAALVTNRTTIESFDAQRLAMAAEALFRKRQRGVEKTWPNLARSLGESFAAHFRDFAAQHPSPAAGSPFADGWEFARHLHRSGALPDAGAHELLEVRLAFHRTRRGIVGWRGPFVSWQRLREARRLLIGVRSPFGGVRYFNLPAWAS